MDLPIFAQELLRIYVRSCFKAVYLSAVATIHSITSQIGLMKPMFLHHTVVSFDSP